MHRRDNTYIIACINAIADELDQMTILPKACTPEALSMHEEWMATYATIDKKLYAAKEHALVALPVEVETALERVCDRAMILKNPRTIEEIRADMALLHTELKAREEIAASIGSGQTIEVETQESANAQSI